MSAARLELQGLFQCERFGPLTHRACLRRQLERQELVETACAARSPSGATAPKTGAATHAPKLGPPTRPYCADKCEQGRVIRAGLAHVAARTCAACGSAVIEVGHCARCAARAAESSERPPEVLPPRLAPMTTRVWEPGFTEPDLTAPAAQTRGRERGKAADEAGGRTGPTPPTVAAGNESQEIPMKKTCACGRVIRRTADGVLHEKCSGCRGTSTSLRSADAKAGQGPRSHARPAAEKRPPPGPASKTPAARRGEPGRDLAALDLDGLLALRDAVNADLQRRRAEAEDAARKLREALGDAA